MFNEETCSLCGICLSECPFMELPEDLAQEEISKMVDGKPSDAVINGCALCGFCNAICPTESNPSALMKEIKLKNNAEEGIGGLFLISEEVPDNFFLMALGHETEQKQKMIKKYNNPDKSAEMFFTGCAIPHLFPDLTKTSLLDRFPIIGGMKYCCEGCAFDSFGENEAKVKGEALLTAFKNLGVKKLVSLCTRCDAQLGGAYPKLIEGFDIRCQSFIDYLVEGYRNGELKLNQKVKKRITFHDPCSWRGKDLKIYDRPREFLEIIGAEVVEMEHNRESSLCCGFPPNPNIEPPLSEKIAVRRISEAKAKDVEAIAVNCVGCLNMSPKASEMGIDTFHIIELAQMAIGESPPHRINETLQHTMGVVTKKIEENPNIMTDKYVMRNGQIQHL